VLMRHGDVSYFDAQGQPVTDTDKVVLNEKGRAEADATGAYLKNNGFGKFDRVISSTLPRTVETAERVMRVLGEAGEPTEIEALREIRGGSVRDIPTAELPAAIMAIAQHRVSGDESAFRGETVGELQARVYPAIDRLLDDRTWHTALWVLHGGVNIAILSHALTGDASFYGRLDQGPGCFSIIDVGAALSDSVIRAVNVCPDPTPYAQTWVFEMLLQQNLKARATKP